MRYEESWPHRRELAAGASDLAAPGRTGRESGLAPFQRAMPDGRAELIFNLADPFESRDSDGVSPCSRRATWPGPTRRAMEIRPTGFGGSGGGSDFGPRRSLAWLRGVR